MRPVFFVVLWSKCGVVRAGWLCKNDINIWVWLWGVVGALIYLVVQLWNVWASDVPAVSPDI